MAKVIKSFNLDLSDLPATSTKRAFSVVADNDAEFILEIKDKDTGKYYNFFTNAFQTAQDRLEEIVTGGKYSGIITFPNITGSTDQYDIYLYAKPGTIHTEHIEKRFADGSLDLNGSKGSNSLMMQKVIYQYTDVTLTLSPYSPNSVTDLIKASTRKDFTATLSRGKSTGSVPFSVSCEVNAATKCYQILKQPTSLDILSFVSPTVGSAPELLPGENEYPTISNTDTINGDFTAGSTKIVMDTAVASKMIVGDKVTIETALSENTVDGATTNSNRIVFDGNVASRASVGDRLFLSDNSTMNRLFAAGTILVTHLDPDGDNPKEMQIDHIISCVDGASITFQPKCNQSLTTVAALNPDGDNANEFSLSQSCGLIDGTTLSFSNRKNYQWPLDSIENITEGMIVIPGTNVTTNTKTAKYEDTVTLYEGTESEEKVVKNKAPFAITKNQTPTVVKGLVTVQPGNIVFNKQQKLALAGDGLRIGGYGETHIKNITGYDIKFNNLKLKLTPITTTTTAACINSTSVVVAERAGILDNVSTVSGIGIDPTASNPIVASGAGAVSGAGTIVLNRAQNLESGATLTFAEAGQLATITGDIEIIKVGTGSPTLRFDMEKLLSIT